MGAYLNKPKTEKETETAENEKIRYAATTMQGWRVNQEDAHNCILDLVDGWHLFAVYDGHGGSEVAKYTSFNLPEFLKQRDVFSAEDIVKVLEDTFVDFDDVLRSENVMKELKRLSQGNTADAGTSDDEDDGEETNMLFEESTAPIEQLLARYGYALVRNGAPKGAKQQSEIEGEQEGETAITVAKISKAEEGEDDGDAEGSSGNEKKNKRPNASPRQERAKRAKSEKSEEGAEDEEENKGEKKKEAEEEAKEEHKPIEVHQGNGEDAESGDVSAEATFVKHTKAVPVKPKKMVLPADADVSSSDDDDYKEGVEESGDDDEDEGDDEEEEEGEEGEEEEEEDEEMGVSEDAFDGLSGASFGPSGETPGEDSGTTACVCFIAPGRLIVANAGDSRAVLCRAGRAIDLSVDHKPEDDIERERITKAGGCVNEDGRVNGGLNLSRAFGDHCYKKNKILPLREQMISALPDVRIEPTTEEDDFLVVACDGIWNSLDSQQVVDYVKEKLELGWSITKICEEICDHCMADSTAGDGTGCDNMTFIIADLKPSTRKVLEDIKTEQKGMHAPVEKKEEPMAATAE